MRICPIVAGGAALAVCACTTATELPEPGGGRQLMVECGASVPFAVCASRATKECGGPFETLDYQPGFNRTSLRVRCGNPSDGQP
jgi:hypothetical protein